MIARQKCLQGVARCPWVDRAAMKLAMAFEDAADFPERTRQRIDRVELIDTSVVEIDLMRRNERAERERIAFDEIDRSTIVLRSVMEREIDPAQFAVAKLQSLRPPRKNRVDRRLRGGNADEIHRWPAGGSEVVFHRGQKDSDECGWWTHVNLPRPVRGAGLFSTAVGKAAPRDEDRQFPTAVEKTSPSRCKSMQSQSRPMNSSFLRSTQARVVRARATLAFA